jgi:ribosomal protein L31E
MAYNFEAALKSGLSPQEITNYLSARGREQEAMSYFKNEGFGTAIKKKAIDSYNKIDTIGDRKDISSGRKFLRTIGEIAGFGSGVIGEGVSRAIGDKAEQKIGAVVEKVFGGAADKYGEFKMKHPEAAQDLEAVLNIADVGSMFVGGSAVKPKITGAIDNATAKTVAVAKKTSNTAKEVAGNVANKVTDAITPIDEGVETVLKNTETISTPRTNTIDRLPTETYSPKFEQYLKQAQEAVTDYSKKNPLEVAGEQAEKALSIIDNKLKAVGQAKKEALQEVGKVRVDDAVKQTIADLNKGLKERLGVSFNNKGGLSVSKGRMSKLPKEDVPVLRDVFWRLKSLEKSPTIQRADDAVAYIQNVLYKNNKLTAVPLDKMTIGLLKEISGQLNAKIKNAGGKTYKNSKAYSSNLIQTKTKLAKALGVDGNKGASLMKQLFSPTSTAPRKLFEKIKKETGIDLVEEATLAKFAMEMVGDVKQASLLEQVIKGGPSLVSRTGVVDKILDYGTSKLTDPIGKARRIVEKSNK